MGWLEDMIVQYPALAAARDTLAPVEARLTALETENARLTSENEILKKELEAALARIPEGQVQDQFTGAAGVLWKKKPDGKYESVPYCPTCRSPLSDYSGMLLCLKCNWQAPFRTYEAPKIFFDTFGK